MNRDDFRIIQRSMDKRFVVEQKHKGWFKESWCRHCDFEGFACWFDSLDQALEHIDSSIRVENNSEKVVWP